MCLLSCLLSEVQGSVSKKLKIKVRGGEFCILLLLYYYDLQEKRLRTDPRNDPALSCNLLF